MAYENQDVTKLYQVLIVEHVEKFDYFDFVMMMMKLE
jgi:hypothetical protein